MSYFPLALRETPHTMAGIIASDPVHLTACAESERANMAMDYVPLSQRSSDELLAKAAELRAMAETATTEDVVRALESLADRYTLLAERRRSERSVK